MKRNRLNIDPRYTIEDAAVAIGLTIGIAWIVGVVGVLLLGILDLLQGKKMREQTIRIHKIDELPETGELYK